MAALWSCRYRQPPGAVHGGSTWQLRAFESRERGVSSWSPRQMGGTWTNTQLRRSLTGQERLQWAVVGDVRGWTLASPNKTRPGGTPKPSPHRL